ncbi:BSD-domain protein, putative [Plasmodium reichenowi]|uniref:BSD-domain protein, putative n=1 Tax=Plasmodium reichenowi TaxID=5854 RepID=A0A151LHR9_PLARE|nr:BSD-domain protein, putative [Plasmodium reichenowi]KYN98437.1 BSD-domain protein, putative [Plasmodium reichenowi]
MYSLWKEVSDQIKKKAEDLNNSIQELNINNSSIKSNNDLKKNENVNENNPDRSFRDSIQDKLNLLNNKYINKDFSELQYYNEKFMSGFNNIKKMVGDIYKDKLNNLNINDDDSKKKKICLSSIVPWKKADVMISKIYRKKYDQGFPLNLPDPYINKQVYERILKLNTDRNKILHTNILENYNFNWNKKKDQSEQIMNEDPNLINTKNVLVPYYMSEMQFWKSYFFNIDIIYNEIADDIFDNKFNILDNYPTTNILNNEIYMDQVKDNTFAEKKNEHMENKNGYPDNKNSYPDNKNGYPDNKNGYPDNKNGYPDNKNSYSKNEQKANEIYLENNNIKIESTMSSIPNEQNKDNPFLNEKEYNSEINKHVNNGEKHFISKEKEYNSCSVLKDVLIKNEDENITNDIVTNENVEDEKNHYNLYDSNSMTSYEDVYMKKTNINGINIYMDNDIHMNVSEKSNNFKNILNNNKKINDDNKKINDDNKKINGDNKKINDDNKKINGDNKIYDKNYVDNTDDILFSSKNVEPCDIKLNEESKYKNIKEDNEQNICPSDRNIYLKDISKIKIENNDFQKISEYNTKFLDEISEANRSACDLEEPKSDFFDSSNIKKELNEMKNSKRICTKNDIINENINPLDVQNDININEIIEEMKEDSHSDNIIPNKNNIHVHHNMNIEINNKREQELFCSDNLKNDSDDIVKKDDINLDVLNLVNNMEFDIDENKFNKEELEQFEKDILNM